MNLLKHFNDRHVYRQAAGEDIPDGGGGDGEGGFEWPAEWRQQMAGDDEKVLDQLGRYATPADIWTKTKALEQKLSSGEYKQVSAYPEEGTDEEKAAWRASNGVPDAPDKYEIARKMEDDEKAALSGFLEHAHAKNLTATQVNDVVDYLFEKREADAEAGAEADKQDQEKTDDLLRAEWGKEFRLNMNKVEGLLDMVGGGVKDSLLDARMPDGRLLRNVPEVMKFMLNNALSINPNTTLVTGDGDLMSSIEDEIDEIKGKMNTAEYKKPGSRLRARYAELLEARGNMSKRGAA